MKKDNGKPVTVEINKELLDWIEEREKENFFTNQSDGIRKSIQCAKRVYESKNKDDILKYLLGIKI